MSPLVLELAILELAILELAILELAILELAVRGLAVRGLAVRGLAVRGLAVRGLAILGRAAVELREPFRDDEKELRRPLLVQPVAGARPGDRGGGGMLEQPLFPGAPCRIAPEREHRAFAPG